MNCSKCGKYSFNEELCVNCTIQENKNRDQQIKEQNENRKYTYWGRYDRAVDMGLSDSEALDYAKKALNDA